MDELRCPLPTSFRTFFLRGKVEKTQAKSDHLRKKPLNPVLGGTVEDLDEMPGTTRNWNVNDLLHSALQTVLGENLEEPHLEQEYKRSARRLLNSAVGENL